MRLSFCAALIALCVLLPSSLLLWLGRARARSRVYFASVALLTAVVLVVLWKSVLGAWYAVGTFLPWIYAVAFVAILLWRVRRGLPEPWLPRGRRAELLLSCANGVLIALVSLVLPALARSTAYPGDPLELSAPLRGGEFYVMGGGANASVNHHSFVPFQRYALDVVEVGGLGFRASGLSPVALEDYRIFGAEIVAPCDGEVLAAQNGLPNRAPLDPDMEHPFGNHVVLFCAGHSLMLAHLLPGSVAVAVGERVTIGRPLGTVGNSGSTTEPHLHLHAVAGRHADARGEPTPLRVGGRLLVKGDRLSN